MDYKFQDDDEFEEMFNKLRLNKGSSNILESPQGPRYFLTSMTSETPFPSSYPETPRSSKGLDRIRFDRKPARKMLNFSDIVSQQQQQRNNKVEEHIDLNKTFTVKTMDSKEMAKMLSAMEE